MEIRNFTREHIPETLALSTQSGWNHLDQDWLRILDLNPQFCLGGFVDNHLIATCTMTLFGDLGWMGTFLVDKNHQRKGYGSQMFEAAIANGKKAGATWFVTDSSDIGRPIYNRYGFQLDEPIERWTGPCPPPGTPAAATPGIVALTDQHWPALLKMDRELTGVDREKQLRHLAAEPGAAARILEQNSQILAYGFSRRGRLSGSIGPVIAPNDAPAQKIFDALLTARQEIDGDRGIALDALGHDPFKTYLTQKGFQMRRRNIRMYYPQKKRTLLTGPSIYLATGLGMG